MKTIEEIKSTPKTVMKKPELLAPAGNLEKLKIAVHYGADAVFLGGQEYGLRSNADNFTMEEIAEVLNLRTVTVPKFMLRQILLHMMRILKV